ncbi:MAG: DUF1573 domain-containing protein [Ferruginibacter sp.]
MKKLVLSITALFVAVAMFAQTKTVADVAKITNETIDMGKIKQGVPATATFVVTNIGKEPLIIEQASPTCGCTIGDYTKSPIAPGKTGTITATYNAASATHFEKHMTVKFAGVDEVKSITITGDVLDADAYAKWQAENPAPVVKPQPVAAAAPVVPVKAVKSPKAAKKATVPAKG